MIPKISKRSLVTLLKNTKTIIYRGLRYSLKKKRSYCDGSFNFDKQKIMFWDLSGYVHISLDELCQNGEIIGNGIIGGDTLKYNTVTMNFDSEDHKLRPPKKFLWFYI